MLNRSQDWPEKLARCLQASAARPFAWGLHDCALAAADAIAAQTGVDLAVELRGRYDDLAGAAAVIRDFAGGGLEQLVEKQMAAHAAPEIPVKLARRGDLVLFDGGQGATLGIVGMDGRVASVGIDGSARLRLAACRRAWRIG